MEEKDYVIVAYGDSITKGVIYNSEDKKYTTLKDNFINIVSDSIKGTIYNAGKFGSTISRGMTKLYSDVIRKTPDIVLIEFGGNDCNFNWAEIATNPEELHKPNTDIFLFKDTLIEMIKAFTSSNIKPILLTLPPLDPLKYFNWISKDDSKSKENILNWLGSKDTLFNWHNTYNQVISEVAIYTRTPMIDIRGAFLKTSNYSKLLCSDGIHPNSEGHTFIAEILLSYIKDNFNFLLKNKV
ncbi:MAG TPA: SGNH/GDSL hydrolase family protein [Clostridiaceae bacterium]